MINPLGRNKETLYKEFLLRKKELWKKKSMIITGKVTQKSKKKQVVVSKLKKVRLQKQFVNEKAPNLNGWIGSTSKIIPS